MAFRHIRSIISEASADQTLYTVPSGKEFMLLRTRARYEGGSSSGDGSGDIIASNGTVIFAKVNGAFNRAGTTTVHGVTAPYYSRILDSSTSYYVTRVYSMAHQSVMWIITAYDASGTAENWVEDEGFSAMAYVRSDATSPVGLTFESMHGTPPTFSLGGNSSGGSSVDGNVSVSFKVNSGNAFETIDIDHNAVANGKTWMTLCEAGSVIRANSTNADAMAEIMGIELKAGSWESVGGNGGGGGEPAPGGESGLNYFYIEPMSDNARVWCDNFSPSYGLSSSMDKVTWTTLTGGVIASDVPAGTKVYLRGDTSTLGSTTNDPGCRFYSDGAFNAGGKALSLYSPTLEPKELTNEYDLAYFFGSTGSLTSNGKKICECSVDFGPVKSAYRMFSGCSSLSALPDGFSAPNMTDARYMFTNCSSLSSLPAGFSIPNATNTGHMFYYCTSLSALPDNFSAPNTVSADRMFAYCSSLSSLPAGFSAQNVTNANYMFESCSSLSSLPVGFSCPNVTDAYSMFSDCSSLSRLPEGFSCPNVTNAYNIFYNCSSLSALPDGFSVSSATDTRYMFGNCSRLSGLPAGFSIPNVMYAGNMFNGCSSLSALPDGFSCPNVTDANSMFADCTSLTKIGNNVKIANGAGAASTDSTGMDKSRITSIGDNFEWFTNVKFSGTWDTSKGIRNVFPNATSVGSGWRVYDHYDGEESVAPSDLDYFYIEALENGSTITCENFNSSYGLSSSMDKVTWTTLTGSTVATGVQAGTKVYLRGDTSTLGSNGSPGSGCRFVSDKDFKIGGRVLSLYSSLLNDREPTNDNDLAYWLNCVTGYGSRRVTVAADFRPIRNMYAIFADSWTITAADGLDCSTVVNAHSMFGSCYGLKALPDGFSVPNATDTMYMFSTCYDLLALPDGFSAPNTLSADDMFSNCNSLSAIGNNVKVANGAGATGTDNTNINKSQITSIGDNFEWFTNAKFSGTWDPALGIRNVFPNATSVGSGWRVYDHYDGE